ncbi:MAG: hypothetical protein GTO18_21855 [Anaerolineales bacterium]|nr:hypothetical protein [Anaerolineales bacterium]
MGGGEHWDKLMGLIDLAKADPEISEKLRHGKPSEVAQIIESQAGMSMEDLGLIFDDLEYIADRNSIQWWSPLA